MPRITAKAWTQKEDSRLRELYVTLTISEIARIMGRPKGSVCSRADRLGLAKLPKTAVPSRIGTITRPQAGVLVHIGRYGSGAR